MVWKHLLGKFVLLVWYILDNEIEWSEISSHVLIHSEVNVGGDFN